MNYLKNIRRYSEHSVRGYGNDLRQFARWMMERREDARWSTTTRDDLDAWIEAMTLEGRTPNTINRRVSSVKAFYNWLRRNDQMETNPMQHASYQKRDDKIPNTIPVGDLQEAMAREIGTSGLMIRLLAKTGIRLQEMLDLDIRDIDAELMTVKIHGKGRKERTVYMDAALTTEVTDYAKGKTARIFDGIDQRTARRIIYYAMRRYSTARQLSPHAIRHTYATDLARNGANVTTIAKMLGHNSLRTTQQYIDLGQQDVTQAAQMYSSFNK